MTGFVSFVSSGPGDPELLTVKAVDRLQRAEVVLFDDFPAADVLLHYGGAVEMGPDGKLYVTVGDHLIVSAIGARHEKQIRYIGRRQRGGD